MDETQGRERFNLSRWAIGHPALTRYLMVVLMVLGFAAYFVLAIWYAAHMGMWGTIPFLSLFCFGYGYMGVMSLLQTSGVRRWLEALRPAAVGRR